MERMRKGITKEEIDKIFEEAEDQGQYIIQLMKLAVPRFDDLENIEPTKIKVTKETASYICQKCMDWDYKHKVETMKGGAWLNYGFSTRSCPEDLRDFTVDVPKEYIIKED